MTKTHAFFLIVVASFFLFVSCERNHYTSNVESEKLFSLNYGSYENETKLYSVKEGTDFFSGIYMSDGLYYISDSNSKTA